MRADFAPIRAGDGSIVQENCLVRVNLGPEATINTDLVVLYGAILHDLTMRRGASLSMCRTPPLAVVEEEGIVAPGAGVRSGFVVPATKLVSRKPAKIQKDVP